VNGTVSSFVHGHVHAGDILEASAPRGGFTLRSGDAPVVLLSAGNGQRLYSPCSTHCPRLRHFVRSGGSTERITRRSTRLRKSRVDSPKQAESQLRLAQAGLQSTLAQEEHFRAMLIQSKAQHEQAQNAVTTLEPLVNQRGARAAAVETARYNLNNCRAYAPFAARVTNLTLSEGAYAHIGQQVFTLIDARTWWAVANFREGQLQHISPGMRAEVYVMSKPDVPFTGVVDSVGFGVTPDADVVGRLGATLPDVQRALNWVHLATRFRVRVRVTILPEDLFRVSE